MEHNDKKLLIKRISNIAKKSCHLAIFKVLVDNHIEYTINKMEFCSMHTEQD